jgi:hypothetical protein
VDERDTEEDRHRVAEVDADPDDPGEGRRLVSSAHDASGQHGRQRDERREDGTDDHEGKQGRIAPNDPQALRSKAPPAPDPLHLAQS